MHFLYRIRKLQIPKFTLNSFRNLKSASRRKMECYCPKKVEEKMVVEKSCEPCSFWSWKPKCVKLIPRPIKPQDKPHIQRKCHACLNDIEKKTTCEMKDIAVNRWKQMDPKNKNPCPETPIVKPEKNDYCCPKSTVPNADWDHDGRMGL